MPPSLLITRAFHVQRISPSSSRVLPPAPSASSRQARTPVNDADLPRRVVLESAFHHLRIAHWLFETASIPLSPRTVRPRDHGCRPLHQPQGHRPGPVRIPSPERPLRKTRRVFTFSSAILDMKLQRDKLHQYQRRIQAVLTREREIAIESLRAGNKQRALLALRRRKYQESLLRKTDEQLETLEKLVGALHQPSSRAIAVEVAEARERARFERGIEREDWEQGAQGRKHREGVATR